MIACAKDGAGHRGLAKQSQRAALDSSGLSHSQRFPIPSGVLPAVKCAYVTLRTLGIWPADKVKAI